MILRCMFVDCQQDRNCHLLSYPSVFFLLLLFAVASKTRERKRDFAQTSVSRPLTLKYSTPKKDFFLTKILSFFRPKNASDLRRFQSEGQTTHIKDKDYSLSCSELRHARRCELSPDETTNAAAGKSCRRTTFGDR